MTSVTVELSPQQAKQLQALCDHSGEPLTELIQRIVAVFLDPERGERAYYRKLKRRLCKARGHACEVCGARRGLRIHHRHYRTRFYESLDDLKLVCGNCQSAFQARAKNKMLEPKDIPLIDPKMDWLIEKIRRDSQSRTRRDTIDNQAVDESNLRFEADFAARLKAQMDTQGKRSVTVREAHDISGVIGVDVASALLRALVARHGWISYRDASETWHFSPYADGDGSYYVSALKSEAAVCL